MTISKTKWLILNCILGLQYITISLLIWLLNIIVTLNIGVWLKGGGSISVKKGARTKRVGENKKGGGLTPWHTGYLSEWLLFQKGIFRKAFNSKGSFLWLASLWMFISLIIGREVLFWKVFSANVTHYSKRDFRGPCYKLLVGYKYHSVIRACALCAAQFFQVKRFNIGCKLWSTSCW